MISGRRIRGEGNPEADIFVCGEYPNENDARCGRPFSPRRNRPNELDNFFNGADLPSRQDIYTTTLIKEWGGKDYDYIASDYERDEPEFVTELQAVQPRIIVTLGRDVSRWFLGDVDMEEVHGIP